MNCIRCEELIPELRKSEKYCSFRCSKLWLKAQYKIRKGIHKKDYIPDLESDKTGRNYIDVCGQSKKSQLRAKSREKFKKVEECIICKDPNAHRHHENYNDYKTFSWLCQKHHNFYHRLKNIDLSFTIGDYERGMERGSVTLFIKPE